MMGTVHLFNLKSMNGYIKLNSSGDTKINFSIEMKKKDAHIHGMIQKLLNCNHVFYLMLIIIKVKILAYDTVENNALKILRKFSKSC